MATEAATPKGDMDSRTEAVMLKGDMDSRAEYGEKQSTSDNETELGNLVYDIDDVEPQLHLRTWVALGALFLLNFVIIVGLNGVPSVLTYIAEDLDNTANEVWITNCPSLIQTVLGPIICFASDTFQARKNILLGIIVLCIIGGAIAPGSGTIWRLVGAQILLGFGQAIAALAYAIPSEIVPRRWRPMTQGVIGVATALGACAGPLIAGALIRDNAHLGWRDFYWFQMGVWCLSGLGILIGYRPPPRHTRLDHLSLPQKIRRLDIPGTILLAIGLTLFLVGLNLRSAGHPAHSAVVIAPLTVGLVVLVGFVLYEWKGTSTGIIHHGLFKEPNGGGRNFAICLGLVACEGIVLLAYVIFYPILTVALFETDPFLQAARSQSFWLAFGISTVIYGAISTKFRIIREPLIVGFIILTAGVICLATVQPSDNLAVIAYAALAGVGAGAPIALIITIIQLSVPHHFIATATALIISSRGVFGIVASSIFFVAVNPRLANDIPSYVSAAALKAGLPPASLYPFIGALAGNQFAALPKIPGVTPAIIGASVAALKQAYADGIRVVFEIAAPFGALAVIGCFFLGSVRKTMNYHVDAPVEELTAKHESTHAMA